MTMKSTVTRAAVAAVAGLAIVADAFLLFVKPHLQQSGSGAASLASGQPLGSTGASGDADGTDADAGQSGSGSSAGSDASSESDAASGSDSGTSAGSEASSGSGATTSSSGMKDGTYTSVASPNQYGEVQLQVTVKDGRITTVTALTYPNHTQRSQSISAQAIPELSDRAVAAQSSSIQYVSGATETSTAFVNSLQDAINQALNAGK